MATEQVQVFTDGVLVDTYDIEIPDDVVNRRTIEDRARTALVTNADYLALVAPTQAQAVAQVDALTRQVNGIIRLVLQRFDSAD